MKRFCAMFVIVFAFWIGAKAPVAETFADRLGNSRRFRKMAGRKKRRKNCSRNCGHDVTTKINKLVSLRTRKKSKTLPFHRSSNLRKVTFRQLVLESDSFEFRSESRLVFAISQFFPFFFSLTTYVDYLIFN